MEFKPEFINTICNQVINHSAAALRAMRISQRQARLIEPAVLSPEQAEIYDLNQLVYTVVEEALPLCNALGIRPVLQQDPRLPAVPLLISPIEDILSTALDLCLDEDTHFLRIKTRAGRSRAVTTVERWCRSASQSTNYFNIGSNNNKFEWCDTGPMGHVEFIIGERMMRALGGKLRIQRRGKDLRFCLELPSGERPQQARQVGGDQRVKATKSKSSLDCPGITSHRQTFHGDL